MVILVDIGNSNIVLAKYKNGIHETYRFNTDRHKSVDEYYVLLQYVLQNVSGMMISSVVPELNIIFKNLSLKYLNIEPIFVGPGIKTNMKIKIDNPKELGTDIVCDTVGVKENYNQDTFIIVDMGTATTISYTEKSEIKGVSISAGLMTQKDALIGHASQLIQFEFKNKSQVVGTNTVDSLNIGLLHGHAHMVQGLVNDIKQKYQTNPDVYITGGASRYMVDVLPNEYIFDEHLLLKGLYAIYQKNN